MVHVFAEEAGAGHRAYADLLCEKLTELQIAVIAEFGYVEKYIVCALRYGMPYAYCVQSV